MHEIAPSMPNELRKKNNTQLYRQDFTPIFTKSHLKPSMGDLH